MIWGREERARADRLDRAREAPGHLFDDETRELTAVGRSLRPAHQQPEAHRAAILEAGMRAYLSAVAEGQDQPAAQEPPAQSRVVSEATSLLHPTLGRMVVSDVEHIDAERAQAIAERIEQVVSEAQTRHGQP